MKTKIHTLEIVEKIRNKGRLGLVVEEVIAEVDFDLTGFIYEIRVWSEYFQMFVSVNQAWLENNCADRMATVCTALDERIHELMYPKKEFNNDDPHPAA